LNTKSKLALGPGECFVGTQAEHCESGSRATAEGKGHRR
jgi:hypothetical protein